MDSQWRSSPSAQPIAHPPLRQLNGGQSNDGSLDNSPIPSKVSKVLDDFTEEDGDECRVDEETHVGRPKLSACAYMSAIKTRNNLSTE